MKNLPDSIQELIRELNIYLDPWNQTNLTQSELFSKELTEMFCDPTDEDFIALHENIAYHILEVNDEWIGKTIGQLNVLINADDADILPELKRKCSAINWISVVGNISAVYTPFHNYFRDRINIIIDTAYDNLE